MAVERKRTQMVEGGLLVPLDFIQRRDTPRGGFFAEYKVKVKPAKPNSRFPAKSSPSRSPADRRPKQARAGAKRLKA